MSRFKPVRHSGVASLAICPRCRLKVDYEDLTLDPNNGNWYCPECADAYDPWRLAARKPENITLTHPRPETVVTGEEYCILGADGISMGLGDSEGTGFGFICWACTPQGSSSYADLAVADCAVCDSEIV